MRREQIWTGTALFTELSGTLWNIADSRKVQGWYRSNDIHVNGEIFQRRWRRTTIASCRNQSNVLKLLARVKPCGGVWSSSLTSWNSSLCTLFTCGEAGPPRLGHHV
jgi:hypothetical protein